MITIPEIEARLKVLREKYTHALAADKEILKRQARALELARERILKKRGTR